ncbi:iron-sulfur cluster biosynthesis protein [Amycolatopsis carbonis]|uniref:Iron-sulfur cluster biosynthesis protein n=1 Tax=Amycolatopsis carbonis TaxID=715471 RepID=A0A9Y2I8U0_9PSEU|nr:iron-sulfur cluster biosynthesis protein [Amycolatopsis sp. 2-15]WIX75109.1 iron-sulfur cluster biosynthesis protein [Amycolatopsis sp. 2-15]
MFTITESAAEAIKQLIAAQNIDADGGLRLTLDGPPEDSAALSVAVTAHPAAGDDVVASAGAHVFLARETRTRLADKVLDVRKDIDGHYTFLITITH